MKKRCIDLEKLLSLLGDKYELVEETVECLEDEDCYCNSDKDLLIKRKDIEFFEIKNYFLANYIEYTYANNEDEVYEITVYYKDRHSSKPITDTEYPECFSPHIVIWGEKYSDLKDRKLCEYDENLLVWVKKFFADINTEELVEEVTTGENPIFLPAMTFKERELKELVDSITNPKFKGIFSKYIKEE